MQICGTFEFSRIFNKSRVTTKCPGNVTTGDHIKHRVFFH
jgi:hypothetical protein